MKLIFDINAAYILVFYEEGPKYLTFINGSIEEGQYKFPFPATQGHCLKIV